MSLSRRVLIAFAASMLFHLILLTVLALTPEVQPMPVTQDEEAKENAPFEVTLVQAVATPTPAPTPSAMATPEPVEKLVTMNRSQASLAMVSSQSAAVKTQLDPVNLKKSDKAPENAAFIASHNSIATKPKPHPMTRASTKAPAQPTERVGATLENTVSEDALATSLPRPTPVPQQSLPLPNFRTALPRPTPVPVSALPKLPGAVVQAAPAAVAPSTSPSGASAKPIDDGADEAEGVDAIGKWNKAVANAIGSGWNFYRQSKLGLLGIGEVRIKFTLDAQGHVSDMRIVSNTATPTNAIYAARAVKEAEIPPIPPERLARLRRGSVEIDYTFTILPTQ